MVETITRALMLLTYQIGTDKYYMQKILISSLSTLLLLGSPTSKTSTANDPTRLNATEEKNEKSSTEVQIELRSTKDGRITTREELISAIIHIESTGNPKAVGDTHLDLPSIGCMQIRPIMVREVNRILKKSGKEKRYKLKDRFNRNSSIEMFNVWADAYHIQSSFEKMARNWNGGPKGYTRKKTIKYWAKIKAHAKNNL